jgi:hypothetical protein
MRTQIDRRIEEGGGGGGAREYCGLWKNKSKIYLYVSKTSSSSRVLDSRIELYLLASRTLLSIDM